LSFTVLIDDIVIRLEKMELCSCFEFS